MALSQLPRDAQWAILDNLPFIDVITKSPQLTSSVPDHQYFQRRLINKEIIDVAKYQSLLKIFNDPKDAYIKTLIDAKMVNRDPTVLIYLSESDILFPGLEFFIGLGRMGLRAIGLNSPDYLLYVLKLFPNRTERMVIIGTLFMRYMDTKSQIQILPHDLLMKLFRTIDFNFQVDGRYYPNTEETYHMYRSGTQGLLIQIAPDFSQKIFGHESTDIYIESYLPYFYGLIDADKNEVFVQQYTHDGLISKSFAIPEYVAQNGTTDMLSVMIGPWMKIYPTIPKTSESGSVIDRLLKSAVMANNVPVAEYLLQNHREEITKEDLIPKSLEMLRLFRNFGFKISPAKVLIGAMTAGITEKAKGQYRMLLDEVGPRVFSRGPQIPGSLQGFFLRDINEIPPYLLSQYFREHPTERSEGNPDETLIWAAMGILIDSEDFYRQEVMLSLGYHVEPESEDEANMIGYLENTVFADIFKDLAHFPMYPNLAKLIS